MSTKSSEFWEKFYEKSEDLIFSGRKYVSSKEAGELSGYSPGYINQLVKTKKIPGKKIGKHWFVDIEALLKYKKDKQASIQKIHEFSEAKKETRAKKKEIKELAQDLEAIERLKQAKEELSKKTEKDAQGPIKPIEKPPAVKIQQPSKIAKFFRDSFSGFSLLFSKIGYSQSKPVPKKLSLQKTQAQEHALSKRVIFKTENIFKPLKKIPKLKFKPKPVTKPALEPKPLLRPLPKVELRPELKPISKIQPKPQPELRPKPIKEIVVLKKQKKNLLSRAVSAIFSIIFSVGYKGENDFVKTKHLKVRNMHPIKEIIIKDEEKKKPKREAEAKERKSKPDLKDKKEKPKIEPVVFIKQRALNHKPWWFDNESKQFVSHHPRKKNK